MFNPPGVLLWVTMGGGKSKIAVDLIMNNDVISKVLIVCPKSVIAVWPYQFNTHAKNNDYDIFIETKGTIQSRMINLQKFLKLAEARGHKAVVVMNYEAVWREGAAKAIKSVGFDCCICDESSKIKSHNSKTSRFLGKLADTVPYRLCLTGTPMSNSPLDVFGQFRFIDKGLYPATFTAFRNRYAILGGPDKNWVFGTKNEDELRDKMFKLTFKAGKDVLDLPDAVHVERFMDLCPKAQKVYDEMEKEFYAQVGEGEITITNALTKLLRLQQLTGGWLKLDDESEPVRLDKGKQEVLAEVIEDLGNEPVVVFCKFTKDLAVVREVADKLNQHKKGSAEWRATYSELSGHENDLAVWQDGHTQVLGVQIQAGGMGIDLTRASKCVYYSVGYSLGDYEQSLARTHRPGQLENVTYIHIKARNTVDIKVYKALDGKHKVIQKIVEGEI